MWASQDIFLNVSIKLQAVINLVWVEAFAFLIAQDYLEEPMDMIEKAKYDSVSMQSLLIGTRSNFGINVVYWKGVISFNILYIDVEIGTHIHRLQLL